VFGPPLLPEKHIFSKGPTNGWAPPAPRAVLCTKSEVPKMHKMPFFSGGLRPLGHILSLPIDTSLWNQYSSLKLLAVHPHNPLPSSPLPSCLGSVLFCVVTYHRLCCGIETTGPVRVQDKAISCVLITDTYSASGGKPPDPQQYFNNTLKTAVLLFLAGLKDNKLMFSSR